MERTEYQPKRDKVSPRGSGFHGPRLSRLHMHRRVQVHSLEAPACFSSMNSHLSMLPLAGFRCQNKPGMYNWPLPPCLEPSLEEPERLCPGLKSSADLPDKHSSRCEAVLLSLFQLTRMWGRYICPDEAFPNATWLRHSFFNSSIQRTPFSL